MLTILLSHERSGSHLLGEAVKSLAGVRMIDEVCNPHAMPADKCPESFHRFHRNWIAENPEHLSCPQFQLQMEFNRTYFTLLDNLAAPLNAVVDIKYGHIHHFEGPWWPLFRRPMFFASCESCNVRIIHLYRLNTVEAAVSAHIAERRKVWHSWQSEAAQMDAFTCSVPVNQIVNDARLLIEQTRWIGSRWMGRIPVLTVTYERLAAEIANPNSELLEEIGTHVGGEVTSAFRPGLKKLGRPLQESVTNHGELVDACKGTDLEKYL